MPTNIYLYLGYEYCKTHDLTGGSFATPNQGESYAGFCYGAGKFILPDRCTGFHVFCNNWYNAVGIHRVRIHFICFDSNLEIIEEKEQSKTFDVNGCGGRTDPACGWFEKGDHTFRNEVC